MQLAKTSLNVIYVKPQITMSKEEADAKLTKFITLFAQVGFRELALNENLAAELEKCNI